MAKLFASEEILKVATHAVELHGGNGMMLDFGVEKLFRDAAIFPHMDGTTDISRFKIVKSMFPRHRRRQVCRAGGVSELGWRWSYLAMAMRKEKVSTRRI